MSSAAPGVGTVLDGRYRLDALVAIGGMGQVFSATQLPLGRKVALKILKPIALTDGRARQRFAQEASLLSRLYHPNTVSILESGQTADGRPWIAMEYVDGVLLSHVIRHQGPLSVESAVRIVTQLAGALEEAHQQGIVHRDVKPDNVLVLGADTDQPFPKILDFGIALEAQSARMTAPGFVCGTTAYMSPEQTRGDHVDARTDVYALGVMLFELIEGRLPYVSGSPIEQAVMHQMAPIPSMSSSVPAAVRAVVRSALAKSPAERPASAGALAEALRGARSTRRSLAWMRAWTSWGRAALVATAAAAAVTGMMLGLGALAA